MQKTITVKKVFNNTTKAGKPYVVVVDTENNKHSIWDGNTAALLPEGTTAVVDVEVKNGYSTIKGITGNSLIGKTESEQRFDASLAKSEAEMKWQQIRDEKTENIRWLNALNNASLLIAHGAYPVNDTLIDTIKLLAASIYNLKTPNA